MGRWSSDTFLIYIHDQINEYSEGWSKKMAEPRAFFNLEGAYAYEVKGDAATGKPSSVRLGVGSTLFQWRRKEAREGIPHPAKCVQYNDSNDA